MFLRFYHGYFNMYMYVFNGNLCTAYIGSYAETCLEYLIEKYRYNALSLTESKKNTGQKFSFIIKKNF